MPTISTKPLRKGHFSLAAILVLTSLTLLQNGARAQVPSRLPVAHSIDLSRYIFPAFGHDAAIVGLLNKNTLLTARYGFDNGSTLDFWDVNTGQIKEHITAPYPVKSNSVAISPDGSTLIAVQNIATDVPNPVYSPHTIYLWNIKSRSLIDKIEFSSTSRLTGAFFAPDASNRLLVTTNAPSRFLTIDLKTHNVINSVKYQYAAYLQQNYVAFSPSSKLLVGLYTPDGSQPLGSFDIFDAKTLKVDNKVGGDQLGHTVDLPLFFISNKKLVLGNTLYDIQTKKATSVLPDHADLHGHCLSPIPGHLGYAIFMVEHTKADTRLELWDIPHEKIVHQWPLPRRPRLLPRQKGGNDDDTEAVLPIAIYVARDDKAFGLLDAYGILRVYDYDFSALPSR